MPLPDITRMVPQFEIIIPSLNKPVKFRTFLVKEEKLLLIALEGKDEDVILNAILQMISNCALQPIKIDELANFDLEYIFLQLRARSVNEVVELSYRCRNDMPQSPEEAEKRRQPDGLCGTVVPIKLNLDNVKVEFSSAHKKQIFLTDTLGVNMRYMNFRMSKAMTAQKNQISEVLTTIASCIESVFDDESVYTNFSSKEMQDWVENLTQSQFSKIQEFFETMPTLSHDIEFNCPKCGYEEIIHLEGLQDFFE